MGTAFGQPLHRGAADQLEAAGVPAQVVEPVRRRRRGGQRSRSPRRCRQDLGASILKGVPEQFRAVVEPLIPDIVGAIHQAFSIAVSAAFQIGVVTTIAGLLVALVP